MHKSLSEAAALLGVALLNYADDEGRFEADVAGIQAQLFRYRSLSKPIEEGLAELAAKKWLVLYEVTLDGEKVRMGCIVKFRKHQVINKPRPSSLPPPPPDLLREAYGNDTVELPPSWEGKGEEWKGSEGSARARGDVLGEVEADKKNGGRHLAPPLDEIIAWGAGLEAKAWLAQQQGVFPVPPDYCRHYHEQKTIKNSWLHKGRVVTWQLELLKWWREDACQPEWQSSGVKSKAELDAELETCTDGQRRRVIQEQLKRMK